jgi:phosphatidylinositol alpha-mannosyltransferase
VRIAQLCPYDLARPGGVQAHIRHLSVALAERGHAVTIIAPRAPRGAPAVAPADPAGIPVVRIGRARRIGFGGTEFEISAALGAERRALRALLREGEFDIVHYHTIWTPLLPLQAFLASNAANVATFHDTPPDTRAGAALRLLFRALGLWLAPRLDAIVAVSMAPARHLPVTARLHIVPPATDLHRFGGEPAPFPQLRDRRLNILFLGRLEPRKGAMTLLRAYHRLAGSGLSLRLIIAGDGPERAALEHYVAAHGVLDVVFAGAFAEDETPRWYATCDIFCAPSLYGESFGIVIAEAMASGKPVVAAANPGYRSILAGEAPDQLVPPGDVAALARRLEDLAQDPSLRCRLGQWGRAAALKYDCRVIVADVLAIYDEALAKRAARSRTAI